MTTDANRLCACERFLIPAGSTSVQEVPLFSTEGIALTNHEDAQCRTKGESGFVISSVTRQRAVRAESVESTNRGREGRIWARIPRVWGKSRKRWGD